jgi:hypothetical protein
MRLFARIAAAFATFILCLSFWLYSCREERHQTMDQTDLYYQERLRDANARWKEAEDRGASREELDKLAEERKQITKEWLWHAYGKKD